MEQKKKRIQMTFDIPEDLKIRIRVAAARRNISMNMFAQRALIEYLTKYDKE